MLLSLSFPLMYLDFSGHFRNRSYWHFSTCNCLNRTYTNSWKTKIAKILGAEVKSVSWNPSAVWVLIIKCKNILFSLYYTFILQLLFKIYLKDKKIMTIKNNCPCGPQFKPTVQLPVHLFWWIFQNMADKKEVFLGT